MQDQYGRVIDYLRISVTDRCNLRCKYCMPPEGVRLTSHEELLSLEELFMITKIMSEMGIRKVRFTGGEPLVRRNLENLIARVGQLEGIEQIGITTNGVLLEEKLPALLDAGITGVNVSLDTMDAGKFQEITGVDALDRVLCGIDKAWEAGLKIKINCVPCREWNAEALVRVAGFAADRPIDVRFIELMPIGCGRQYHGIPSSEVLSVLSEEYGQLVPVGGKTGTSGPAQYYESASLRGKIGLISPMSHKFCKDCNRIRLTAEGRLKLCLHYDAGIELKPLLRGEFQEKGLLEEELLEKELRGAIEAAILQKPKAHGFEKLCQGDAVPGTDERRMVQIGG